MVAAALIDDASRLSVEPREEQQHVVQAVEKHAAVVPLEVHKEHYPALGRVVLNIVPPVCQNGRGGSVCVCVCVCVCVYLFML